MKMYFETVGQTLEQIVREVIPAIRKEARGFRIDTKTSYAGVLDGDVVTTADKRAQEVYLTMLAQYFSGVPVVSEEMPDSVAGMGADRYFIIDPLDGTKAFARRQGGGVGTMIAYMSGLTPIAAYVGDVNTGAVCGFAQDQTPFYEWMWKKYDITASDQELRVRYAHADNPPQKLPEGWQKLHKPQTEGGIFKGVDIGGGGFGTTFCRFWRGEVAAIIITPGHETPWDEAPVQGINAAVGGAYIRPKDECGGAEIFYPTVPLRPKFVGHPFIVCHQCDAGKLLEFLNQ